MPYRFPRYFHIEDGSHGVKLDDSTIDAMEETDMNVDTAGKLPIHNDGQGSGYDEEDIALLEDNDAVTDSIDERDETDEIPSTPPSRWQRAVTILHKNLLPDQGIVIAGFPMVEGEFTVKLVKFVLLTFVSIAVVHKVVEHYITDRDRNMKLFHIWRFDTNLIVMDSIVFFLIGRLWKQRGVDHLAWFLPLIVCNIYFESQAYIPWLQHSVSLFEIHCIWPWQLWVFVMILVPTIGSLVLAHVHRAWTKKVLLIKIVELSMCIFFFLAPVMSSPYFHLHHWFAGWLLGMHCNFDVWWSRVVMAYCWGMYINGIAVYGRDPVLTCEYAYFLTIDNKCPYAKCYLDALKDMAEHPKNATHVVEEMTPIDWRNCSASGYHP